MQIASWEDSLWRLRSMASAVPTSMLNLVRRSETSLSWPLQLIVLHEAWSMHHHLVFWWISGAYFLVNKLLVVVVSIFKKTIHINLQAYLGKMIHFDFFAYFSFMGWWVQPPKACFQPGSWSHAPFAKTKQGSYDRCGGQAFNCRQGNLDVFGNPSFFLGFTILFYPRTYGSSGKLTLKWKVTILLEIKKTNF